MKSTTNKFLLTPKLFGISPMEEVVKQCNVLQLFELSHSDRQSPKKIVLVCKQLNNLPTRDMVFREIRMGISIRVNYSAKK